MPVYEYECKACGKEFEYQQRMSDPDKTVCEACGGELARLISRTAFQLKGSGWYKDLYSSSKPESKAADKASDAKDGGAASTADKPAAKSDTGTGSGTSGGSGGGGTGGGDSGGGGSSSSSAGRNGVAA